MSGKANVYYLANFYYGELRVAVGEIELAKIQSSKYHWEVVDKDKFDQLNRMYEAGMRDHALKIGRIMTNFLRH